ncbi:hypothetical protein D8911_14635 (plasmid) [Levilactobacillus brevis]|nr:hypothetical protein D8911_14635 [Levilactobacillus brevis]
MGVTTRIDGLMVLTGAAVVGAGVVYAKWDDIKNYFNPAHEDNFVNQTAKAVVGEERLTGFFDHYFSAAELGIEWFTPFGDGDTEYAKSVWGIGEPLP